MEGKRSVKSCPLRLKRTTRDPDLWACTRQPSNLTSCTQSSPAGTLLVVTGLQGWTKWRDAITTMLYYTAPCPSNACHSRPMIALPAWRRACLAYRQWRQAGASGQEAHESAIAAVQTVPSLPWNEASAEVVNAVAYATQYHPGWFWKGAQHTKKWRSKIADNLSKAIFSPLIEPAYGSLPVIRPMRPAMTAAKTRTSVPPRLMVAT
jgi:hypothetical protein